jgi:hypothetical protein
LTRRSLHLSTEWLLRMSSGVRNRSAKVQRAGALHRGRWCPAPPGRRRRRPVNEYAANRCQCLVGFTTTIALPRDDGNLQSSQDRGRRAAMRAWRMSQWLQCGHIRQASVDHTTIRFETQEVGPFGACDSPASNRMSCPAWPSAPRFLGSSRNNPRVP